MSSTEMKKNIVIVGGGYAGIFLIPQIEKFLPPTHRIVLIEEQEFMYARLAALRAGASEDIAEKILIPYNRLFKSDATGVVVQAKVVDIKEHSVTLSAPHRQFGNEVPFDYLVVAVGSSWRDPVALNTKSRADAISLLAQRRAEVAAAKTVVIIGGGAVGIELAGEIRSLDSKKKITIVHAGGLPLSHHYPDSFRKKVLDGLKEKDIKMLLNEKAGDLDNLPSSGTIKLQSGTKLTADLILTATGARPKGEIIKSLAPALYNPETSSIRVKGTLQVDDDRYPNIFVAGDVADTGDVKMTYKAGLHAPIIAKNIKSLFKGAEPNAIYTPATAEMICLPLGKNGGFTYIPMFGGMTLGNFITKQLKAKDLFVTRQVQAVQRY